VLIDETGTLVWRHINDGPGDHADLETVLKQVRSLTRSD
jgi:hypothetical protein